MVDIYADEGITGTSVEKREDFQRMMQDCRKGKIDRILVKSISRFARNTKDCLAAVRELKELDVSVQFEEQGIDTSKVSSEMVTAIMASLAQKGSESISSNVRWGVQKRMLDGTFISSSVPYGYEMFHGQLRILPSEAQFVKWIFQAYLSGLNAQSIAEQMNQAYVLLGIENTRKWHNTTILYILSNERYIGDSLWQKTYATDSLPTRQIKNTGSKTQYYIEHTHTPIIDRDTYSAVQRLREKRKLDAKYNDDYQPNILKKRIMCANCNVPFQRKLRSGETKWIEFIIIAKTIAPLSRLKKRLSTMLSAACTTNSNTTANPFSRKCSRISKRSAIAECSGARMLSLSTRKYPTYSVRFNS